MTRTRSNGSGIGVTLKRAGLGAARAALYAGVRAGIIAAVRCTFMDSPPDSVGIILSHSAGGPQTFNKTTLDGDTVWFAMNSGFPMYLKPNSETNPTTWSFFSPVLGFSYSFAGCSPYGEWTGITGILLGINVSETPPEPNCPIDTLPESITVPSVHIYDRTTGASVGSVDVALTRLGDGFYRGNLDANRSFRSVHPTVYGDFVLSGAGIGVVYSPELVKNGYITLIGNTGVPASRTAWLLQFHGDTRSDYENAGILASYTKAGCSPIGDYAKATDYGADLDLIIDIDPPGSVVLDGDYPQQIGIYSAGDVPDTLTLS